MTSPRRPRRRLLPRLFVGAIVVVAVMGVLATAALYFDIGGLRGRASALAERIELAVNPPPDRPIEDEVLVTPRPAATPTPIPTATASLAPGQTPPPTPAPTPTPRREPVDVDLLAGQDPKDHFITELDHAWCAVAATQMV